MPPLGRARRAEGIAGRRGFRHLGNRGYSPGVVSGLSNLPFSLWQKRTGCEQNLRSCCDCVQVWMISGITATTEAQLRFPCCDFGLNRESVQQTPHRQPRAEGMTNGQLNFC